jgi:hypothetical protein
MYIEVSIINNNRENKKMEDFIVIKFWKKKRTKKHLKILNFFV